MDASNLMVAGRKFRSRADYEAALRDERKIQGIRKQFDLTDRSSVLKLYQSLQAGEYTFESAVGNDFDDEIFDLAEKLKSSPDSGNSGRTSKRLSQHKPKQKSAKEPDEAVSLDSFDDGMRQEILAVLRKKERRRRWTVAGCGLLAAACFAYFGFYYFFADRTDQDMEELVGLKDSAVLADMSQASVPVHRTEEIELPDILDKYKTLYNKNKKLIGWLLIDDILEYPVMQTTNNEYYLDHNFNQEYDKNGSIFMDYRCELYPRNTNLILYGHHMKSGKMFGKLQNYASEAFYQEHPYIRFDTIYEEGIYEIMYAFRSRVYNDNEIVFKYYQFFDAISQEEFDSNMRAMADMSLYDTGVTASFGDQLLTLSTCDSSQSDGRFVVVAKRIS